MMAHEILKVRLFNDLFIISQKKDLKPDDVIKAMIAENLDLSESTMKRRTSTIINIVNWINLQVI